MRVIQDIETQADAEIWIVRNQLARRNLSDLDRVALALQLKPLLEEQARQRQGTRNDLVQISAQSAPGHKVRDDLAKTAGVSHDTLAKAETILTHGSPDVIDATRRGELSIHAAVPLTTLAPEDQAAALEDARQEAEGKPTARITQGVVSRVQVVATVKAQLAAGQSPQAAVAYALETHAITVPTPALADAVAEATGRRVTLVATDGYLHDGRTKAEETATMAKTKRLFQLLDALEALVTLTPPALLIPEIPSYYSAQIDTHLPLAQTALAAFSAAWEDRCEL